MVPLSVLSVETSDLILQKVDPVDGKGYAGEMEKGVVEEKSRGGMSR